MTLLGEARSGEASSETGPVQSRAPEKGRRRPVSGGALGVAWLGLTCFLTYLGFLAVHSYFGPFDDEGYWLISLRTYHLHGSLYHNTFSQAGPFYYEIWSLVYSLFGMQVNWDTGRLITLAVWIATSVVIGVAVWILSRRALLGVLAEVVSFLVLFVLSAIPMEPAGLAHLMGAA